MEETRAVSTPAEDGFATNPKNRDGMVNSEANGPLLNPFMTTMKRAVLATPSHLGQDRSDIKFALQELGRDMSTPSQAT